MENRGDTMPTAGNLPVGRINHLCEHPAGIAECDFYTHVTLMPYFPLFYSQPG